MMKFGICCSSGILGQDNEDLNRKIARLADFVRQSDIDFVEFNIAELQPEGEKSRFDELQRAVKEHDLPLQSFNCLIPAHHKITGPNVQLDRVLDYCRVVFERCAAVGGKIIVLGSGGARRVPEGWSHEKARIQFIAFCRALNQIAQEANVIVVLEPLNKREDNFLNSVRDGAALVAEIACSNIQLLADQYHMDEDGENYAHVAEAGAFLRHTHTADLGRCAPGFSPNGETKFTDFFAALRHANYAQNDDARIAIEGSWSTFEEQAAPAVALLRRRYDESAS